MSRLHLSLQFVNLSQQLGLHGGREPAATRQTRTAGVISANNSGGYVRFRIMHLMSQILNLPYRLTPRRERLPFFIVQLSNLIGE